MKRVLAISCMAAAVVFRAPWASTDPLVVGMDPQYRLGGHLEILRDSTRKLTFSQVLSSDSWHVTADNEPNPGFTPAVYWVRFQLDSVKARRLILALNWANVDLVNVFVMQ